MDRLGPRILFHGIMVVMAMVLGCYSAAAETVGPQVAQEGNDADIRTIVDGVFNPEQAERGHSAYETHCSSCHSEDLQGMSATALVGPVFIDTWREDRLSNLFSFIQTRMPPRNGGSLSDETYVDILTHMLSTNGFPAGTEALPVDQVDNVQFVGLGGPAPVPEFALIHVVGCLAEDPDEGWILTHVSTPARAREPERMTDAELRAARDRPLGTGTFRLAFIDDLRPGFQPELHVGRKLHGKGYLLRNDQRGDGLSVTRLEAVASACAE